MLVVAGYTSTGSGFVGEVFDHYVGIDSSTA